MTSPGRSTVLHSSVVSQGQTQAVVCVAAPCMLGSLVLFAIGSAPEGAALDIPMLIPGRSELHLDSLLGCIDVFFLSACIVVQGVGVAGIGSSPTPS
jgi:hypothetical protein